MTNPARSLQRYLGARSRAGPPTYTTTWNLTWLASLGLSEFTRLFAENRIDDLGVLPHLTEQDLKPNFRSLPIPTA